MTGGLTTPLEGHTPESSQRHLLTGSNDPSAIKTEVRLHYSNLPTLRGSSGRQCEKMTNAGSGDLLKRKVWGIVRMGRRTLLRQHTVMASLPVPQSWGKLAPFPEVPGMVGTFPKWKWISTQLKWLPLLEALSATTGPVTECHGIHNRLQVETRTTKFFVQWLPETGALVRQQQQQQLGQSETATLILPPLPPPLLRVVLRSVARLPFSSGTETYGV